MRLPASVSWTGSLDDFPPIGEILVGWSADVGKSRPGHRGRSNGPFSTFGFLRVTTDPASLVPVGRDGMRRALGQIRWDEEALPGLGRPWAPVSSDR